MQGARARSAILLTTHSMEEAGELCDRIAIMARGALQALATSHALTQHYSNTLLLSLGLCLSPAPPADYCCRSGLQAPSAHARSGSGSSSAGDDSTRSSGGGGGGGVDGVVWCRRCGVDGVYGGVVGLISTESMAEAEAAAHAWLLRAVCPQAVQVRPRPRARRACH